MTQENKSFFPDREGMDLSTPHGLAQARLDEMFEVAKRMKTRITYKAPGETDSPKQDSEPITEADVYFAKRDALKANSDPKFYKAPRPKLA